MTRINGSLPTAQAWKTFTLHLAALWLCCAATAHAADEKASNKRAVKAVGEQRLDVNTAAGHGSLAMYASGDWLSQTPKPEITRAVLVFHGRLRNANVYWRTAEKAAEAVGTLGRHTLLIVPQFLAERDVEAHHLPPETLRWSLEGWMGGAPALAPVPISSFEAIDAVLTKLADRVRFPKLTQIVVAGHSGGAQIVQRYAVVGQGEATLREAGIHVRYVVANPSSYLYFSDERPLPDGRLTTFSAKDCSGFNQWKYGWTGAPAYANRLSAANYEQRYGMRDVIYLLGTADIDPNHPALDKSCAAEAQGPHRFARGGSYLRHLRKRHPELKHRELDVPGGGHDGDRMFTSACGLTALFDDPAAAAKCAAQQPARDALDLNNTPW